MVATGWHGAWEFPIGSVNTVASRARTNAQNERFERHVSLIATAMQQDEFHRDVIEPLLDARTCPSGNCSECRDRAPRDLADVLIGFANGADQIAVHLFARWQPTAELADRLAAYGVALRAHALTDIPKEDLDANRFYHLWSGSPKQAEIFRHTVWAPAWRKREG